MKDLRSGQDAWRNIVGSAPQQRAVESHLPLILSAAGAFGVLPFMVLRYMRGEWAAAVVDTIIVLGLSALGIYVYKSRRVVFASITISCICIVGIISTVYIIGPN